MKTVTPAFVLAAAIAVLCSCSTAQADILVGDYQNPGDGLLTIDTDSGLEWLRWNKTAGISYNSMITLFGVGETYEGWRHATSDEARVLLGSDGFGIPLVNWPEVTRIDDGGAHVRNMISFFGQAQAGFVIATAAARLQPEGGNQLMVNASDGDFEASFIRIREGPDPDSKGFFLGGEDGFFLRVQGHALVRVTNSVPEPTTSLLCLFGLGTYGLTLRRR